TLSLLSRLSFSQLCLLPYTFKLCSGASSVLQALLPFHFQFMHHFPEFFVLLLLQALYANFELLLSFLFLVPFHLNPFLLLRQLLRGLLIPISDGLLHLFFGLLEPSLKSLIICSQRKKLVAF